MAAGATKQHGSISKTNSKNAMKPLPPQFRHDGFDFRVLEREGGVVLLSKTKPHYTRLHFEVCIVRRCPERTIVGKLIPARECLPTPEHWGTYGWTRLRLGSRQGVPPGGAMRSQAAHPFKQYP